MGDGEAGYDGHEITNEIQGGDAVADNDDSLSSQNFFPTV